MDKKAERKGKSEVRGESRGRGLLDITHGGSGSVEAASDKQRQTEKERGNRRKAEKKRRKERRTGRQGTHTFGVLLHSTGLAQRYLTDTVRTCTSSL